MTAYASDPTDSSAHPMGWFAGLDGLRAIAAFLIVLHHAGAASGLTFRSDLVGHLVARMDIGVSIFFVLSGFLLYRPFVTAQFEVGPLQRQARSGSAGSCITRATGSPW